MLLLLYGRWCVNLLFLPLKMKAANVTLKSGGDRKSEHVLLVKPGMGGSRAELEVCPVKLKEEQQV